MLEFKCWICTNIIFIIVCQKWNLYEFVTDAEIKKRDNVTDGEIKKRVRAVYIKDEELNKGMRQKL